MKCEKHGCEMQPLFTSEFCQRCDEEQLANERIEYTPAEQHLVDFYAAQGVICDPRAGSLTYPAMPVDCSQGWYHGYPVVDDTGTDANGSPAEPGYDGPW